ncbi:hypothetical protein RIB2604_02006280 [Aspergillus luchuensis]|uniref:Uncharacterized protein n=1 Tax=Aspergillus kawachii TaxID=1069201 RepID=A0A146FJY1_ASPKA|nr:hypothetical protein RIB2604_02006280 [Aspergillus luchuensis]
MAHGAVAFSLPMAKDAASQRVIIYDIRGTATVAAAAGGWHNRPLIDAHSTWGRWSNRTAGAAA